MNKKNISLLYRRLNKSIASPETELEYDSPFELLIAVALSAQSTDVAVNKATRKLFPVANTPTTIYKLGVEGLIPYIKTIGLYNSKAKHIIKACQMIETLHKGEVPQTRDALESLPGVGRKTANVILNTAFGHPTIAVDTHIFRVSNRTGLSPGKDVLRVELGLLQVTPRRYLKDAHHLLILHGRYVCKAQKPRCNDCCIQSICEFPDKS